MANSPDNLRLQDLQRALPSIFAFSVYLLVPWYARQTLYYWRAIQVYERQPITTQVKDRAHNSPSFRNIIPLLSLEMVALVSFVADAWEWRERRPLLSRISEAMPTSCLVIMIMDILLDLLPYYPAWTDRNISRHASRYSCDRDNGTILLGPANASSTELTASKRPPLDWLDQVIYYATLMFASLAIVQAASIQTGQAPVYIAYTYGLVLGFRIYFSLARDIGFIQLLPFIAVPILSGLIFCLIFPPWYFVATALHRALHWPCEPKERKINSLEIEKFVFIWEAIIMQIPTILPCIPVCFAYRYDATQAGFGRVEDNEADRIVQQSSPAADHFGRRSILTSAVAIPSTRLSQVSFPTFRTAYTALLAFQALGVLVDMVTREKVVYPTHMTQVSGKSFEHFAWPLLNYFVVVFAIIVSACRQSESDGTKNMWAYKEDWIPEKYCATAVVREAEDRGPPTIRNVNERALASVVRFVARHTSSLCCRVLRRVGIVVDR